MMVARIPYSAPPAGSLPLRILLGIPPKFDQPCCAVLEGMVPAGGIGIQTPTDTT